MLSQYPNLERKPKFHLKYILIVFILVVLVGGGILAYQYWWQKAAGQYQTKWQLYENTQSGYSFQLPKTWVHIAQNGESGYAPEIFIDESDLEAIEDDPLLSQNPLLVILSHKVGGLTLDRFARVGSYKDFNLDDLKSYLSQPAGGPSGEYTVSLKSFTEKINDSGMNTYFYTAEIQSQLPVLKNGAAWITPNAVYKLEALIDDPFLKKILEKAAMSFKEKKDMDGTADWKIYRNEERGYSVKYPPGTEIIESEGMVDLQYYPSPSGNGHPEDGFDIFITILDGNQKTPYQLAQEQYDGIQDELKNAPEKGDISKCKIEPVSREGISGVRLAIGDLTGCIDLRGFGTFLTIWEWYQYKGKTIWLIGSPVRIEDRGLFEQAFSTFRFLDL